MSKEVDEIYFKELAKLDHREVCSRCLCKYDMVRKCYILEVWNNTYEIFPEEAGIKLISGDLYPIRKELALVILFYLLKSKDLYVNGEWISEKDLSGGVAFFQGPHTVPSYLISDSFGNNAEAFKKRCEDLDGTPLDFADQSFEFRIAPHVPVAVLFWRGDDEFKTETKILFDKTIEKHFPLDIIFCLTLEVCMRISGK